MLLSPVCNMLTMNASRLIVLLALCFMYVSSNDEPHFERSCELYNEVCDTTTISAPLGSSVLLPCVLSKIPNWVSWIQIPETNLVNLTTNGRIKFGDPRHGRVKAFPNQGSEGNYSIGIDELRSSDLGCYRCEQALDCFQVDLVATEMGTQSKLIPLMIYICVGVAAFILVVLCGYCCTKYILPSCNRAQYNMNNPVLSNIEEVSAPPLGAEMPHDDQERAGVDNLVYENNDQDPAYLQSSAIRSHQHLPGAPDMTPPNTLYPDLSQFNVCADNQRRQRFHMDLFNRLRQASLSRHYYVNRDQINNQQANSSQAENRRREGPRRKKAQENCEYKNPIYNRSPHQFNHP